MRRITRTIASPFTAAIVAAGAMRFHGVKTGDRAKPIKTKWVLPNGEPKDITAFEGQTLLEIAGEHDLPVEGACGGACACSTCHVMLSDESFETFPEATDLEEDMLDLAYMPTPNSRLGCQLKLEHGKHEGVHITLPKATRNMAVDGFVAKQH